MAEPENSIGSPDSIVGGATGMAYARGAQNNPTGPLALFCPPQAPATDARDPATPAHEDPIEAQGLRQITPDGLKASLDPLQVQYIETLEKSWLNYFSIWRSAYPDLALEGDTTKRTQIKGKVDAAASGVEKEFDKISNFLVYCGIDPKNHYKGLRDIVKALKNREV